MCLCHLSTISCLNLTYVTKVKINIECDIIGPNGIIGKCRPSIHNANIADLSQFHGMETPGNPRMLNKASIQLYVICSDMTVDNCQNKHFCFSCVPTDS